MTNSKTADEDWVVAAQWRTNTAVEFSRLGTNVEVCVVVVECLVVLGFVFSVAALGATLLEGDSRKGFSIGVRLD